MEKEVIFNFFPICNDKVITSIGFRVHEYSGSDDKKIKFLLSRVEEDSKEMAFAEISENFKVKLPNGKEVNGLTHTRYNSLLHNGTEGVLYEPIFQLFNAPKFPLSVSTMIVNGKIKITEQKECTTIPKTEFTTRITEEIPNHYLTEYITDDGFELCKLINSDFFEAIQLLYNNQRYVSTLKLLMSAIDTFAFLEFGDKANNFKDWLKEYCIVSKLNLTEDELWEYRNSILHMTNAYSRKVIDKKISKLSFYVNREDVKDMISDGEAKYFNLFSLINVIASGVDKWGESFNAEREKFKTFCDRYDLIISDIRYNKIYQ